MAQMLNDCVCVHGRSGRPLFVAQLCRSLSSSGCPLHRQSGCPLHIAASSSAEAVVRCISLRRHLRKRLSAASSSAQAENRSRSTSLADARCIYNNTSDKRYPALGALFIRAVLPDQAFLLFFTVGSHVADRQR